MSSGEADDETPVEDRLVEYDTTVPVLRRVVCSHLFPSSEDKTRAAVDEALGSYSSRVCHVQEV